MKLVQLSGLGADDYCLCRGGWRLTVGDLLSATPRVARGSHDGGSPRRVEQGGQRRSGYYRWTLVSEKHSERDIVGVIALGILRVATNWLNKVHVVLVIFVVNFVSG